MIRSLDSITIDRPAPDVFAFLSDLGNMPKWQSEVVTSTVTTAGPVRSGTKFTETVKLGPWKLRTECEVTRFEPERLFGFRARSKPIAYEGRFTFEPSARGTKLMVDVNAQLNGFWKLLQPMLAGDIRKGIKHELQAIKQNMENASTASSV